MGTRSIPTDVMRVVVVEGDADIAEALSTCLRLHWPNTVIRLAPVGRQGWQLTENTAPDLVVLDLDLPDVDGLEVLQQIRFISDVPVVVLCRNQRMKVIQTLEAGADDCVTKPLDYMEFLARVKTVLRRTGARELTSGRVFRCGNLSIDFHSREVRLDGKPVKLTPTEYNLLLCLTKNAGRTVPRQALLKEVWGEDYADATDYLKVYVKRLRTKLADHTPQFIITERKIGYKVEEPG